MSCRVLCVGGLCFFGCGPKEAPADTAGEGSSSGSTGTPTTTAGESGSMGTPTTTTGESGSTGTSTTADQAAVLGCSGLVPGRVIPASSTREGAIVAAFGSGARFEIPPAWLQWHAEHGDNLHLSRPELEAVRVGVGDWDAEYGHVLAELFDHDCCAAHVGGEGWGGSGVAFSDLQMRVYILDDLPADIVARARSTAWELVTPEVTVDEGEPWTRVVIRYSNWYGDYGGEAFVDLRLRRHDAATVAYAGMYSEGWDLEAQFDAIVAGECWTPGTGECS